MVKEFEGKGYWALILGGSSGLGFATARTLAQKGMHICILHRNPRTDIPELDQQFRLVQAAGTELITFNLDVVKSENRATVLSALRERLGTKEKLRCLVHSIAKGNLKSMVTEPFLSSEDMTITLQNMAFSLVDWVADIHKAGLFAQDSRVISFTSDGSSRTWQYYGAVSAAKAALEAISRQIALEYAPFGIRANCIQAGVTDTPSLRRIPGNEELIKHTQERNPFKRLTTPQDVADVVYLLCKDEAAWINGAVIPVDGGEKIH
ncbi:enoyl-ACP reductase FabI [Dyadobacter sediminis]|uniref:SDR family oxidoreductase n=1 Tax=Dyadobacter sediminis TaxID=1493691 RepID=A0A5R9KBC8_9BACT|nr:SDR family oxidoreductase [Dyadobacter sediminis]TLU92027.1 SDR family oxidoreductase [Dyadobacter sediminis]GGB98057.1 short-chain dehydrogenase [Dyadobacter sediminis]